jgi:hypothetical protein
MLNTDEFPEEGRSNLQIMRGFDQCFLTIMDKGFHSLLDQGVQEWNKVSINQSSSLTPILEFFGYRAFQPIFRMRIVEYI